MTDETQEHIASCETCSKPIYDDTPHSTTLDGCHLCEDHTWSLSDSLRQQEHALKNDAEPWHEFGYDSRAEMQTAIDDLRNEIEKDGDRKVI